MRVVELDIERWRNFRGIHISVPDDAPLVCLIGENGSGKSNILELLSAAAYRLGICSGIDVPRGDPFNEPHSFSVQIKLADDPWTLVDTNAFPRLAAAAAEWDRTLLLESRSERTNQVETHISAGSVNDPTRSRDLATRIVNQLRSKEEIQHLHLDADRAYPPFQIASHQYADALTMPWESMEHRKQFSFRPTRLLYEQWIQYFLARESRFATNFVSETRQAQEDGLPIPQFVDPFASYKNSLRQVLPHLKFIGVDTERRTLLFDTAGVHLPFSNLSGGEREISFLIGQIERFQLRRGLLLLDEPELHLNPDLLRIWLSFLRDTVEVGQVWITTHSLEAVEVAGHESTFIMERMGDTRLVDRASALGQRPVITSLSTAVGAPAFSLARLRFVFIEGSRNTRERERFYRIGGEPGVNRFLEGGNCDEVLRKLAAVKELAQETDEQLRVGGVIDRDFRTSEQIAQLQAQVSVHVLECHEIENFFLHPNALMRLLERSGRNPEQLQSILRSASDQFAGLWIIQRAVACNPDLRASSSEMRRRAGTLSWDQFAGNLEKRARELANLGSTPNLIVADQMAVALTEAAKAYEIVRDSADLWKECLGKQVLSLIPSRLELNGASALERQIGHLWDIDEVPRPLEALKLRDYIQGLGRSHPNDIASHLMSAACPATSSL